MPRVINFNPQIIPPYSSALITPAAGIVLSFFPVRDGQFPILSVTCNLFFLSMNMRPLNNNVHVNKKTLPC